VADHGEVVRDEEVGEVELLLEVLQQVDDLRLDGDVEGGEGSSQTMKSGSTASALAIPMRWRWPPENSCGKRLAKYGFRPTALRR
jgi:hypothetical protein